MLHIAFRFWSFLRYIFIVWFLLSILISILFCIKPINNKICSAISKSLSNELHLNISIEKISWYPPFIVNCKNITIEDQEIGSLSCTSLKIIPTLLDLPWKRLSCIYLGVRSLHITVPQNKKDEHLNPLIPLQREQIIQESIQHAHSIFEKLSFSPFSQIYLNYVNISLDSIEIEKEKIAVDVSLCMRSCSFDREKKKFQGTFSLAPLHETLKNICKKITAKIKIEQKKRKEGEEEIPFFSLCVSGRCTTSLFSKNDLFNNPIDTNTSQKNLFFTCSLDEKRSHSLFGKWTFTLFDSIDYLFYNTYLSSNAKGKGSLYIDQYGSSILKIKEVQGEVHSFSHILAQCDEENAPPMDLALMNSKNTPFSSSQFFLRSGTIRSLRFPLLFSHLPQKKERKRQFSLRKKKKISTNSEEIVPWKVEYSFPTIQIIATDRVSETHFTQEYRSTGHCNFSLIKRDDGSYTKRYSIQANCQDSILKNSIATLEASFEGINSFYSNGKISLQSPFLIFNGTLTPSSPEITHETKFVSSIQIPSLSPLKFFSETPIDGSISSLFSCTSYESHPLPLSWNIDMLLISASHLKYGSKIQIENIAAALSSDNNASMLLGSYIIKNGSIGPNHWIKLSKSALQYNFKKRRFSIQHGFQNGSVQTVPYFFRFKGYFEERNHFFKKIRTGDNSSLIAGMITAQGRLGTELVSLDSSLSLPIQKNNSSYIQLLDHADFHLSGKIGDQGTFSCVSTLYDWKGEKLLIHGKFSSIPSSIITGLALLPHAKGESSGRLEITTHNGHFFMKYGFSGNFNWLDRKIHNDPIHVTATGEIDPSHIISRVTVKDSSSLEDSPLEVFLRLPVQRTESSFPFFTFSYKAPLYGTMNGSCSLQTVASPWLDEEEWVEGRIQVRSTIRGTLHDHKVIGEISLHNGKFDIASLGSSLSDISMHGTLYGKDIYIDDLRATDEKKGTLYGTGSLLLPIDGKRNFSWKINAQASEFEIINLEYAKSIASGKIDLKGTAQSLDIGGVITSDETFIDIGKKISAPVPDLDIVYINESERNENQGSIEQKEVRQENFDLSLNLKISALKPIDIQGRGLTSSWKGEINLTGSGIKPQIHGSFSTTEGGFLFAGKDFEISHGNITFFGDFIQNSRINVTARSELPNISARVLVRGTIENPQLSLESNPVKSEKEILSYILFNKELSNVSPLESLQLASTAMTLDQTAAPLQFLDTIKKKIGIDTFDFFSSQDGIQSSVCVRIGKYISQGVTVNLSKDFQSDANRIGLELELAKNISAEAEIGDDSQAIVSIKWKKDF